MEDRNEFLGILVDKAGEVIDVAGGQNESLPVNMPALQSRFFRGLLPDWRPRHRGPEPPVEVPGREPAMSSWGHDLKTASCLQPVFIKL